MFSMAYEGSDACDALAMGGQCARAIGLYGEMRHCASLRHPLLATDDTLSPPEAAPEFSLRLPRAGH
jgi:hypothetical protein